MRNKNKRPNTKMAGLMTNRIQTTKMFGKALEDQEATINKMKNILNRSLWTMSGTTVMMMMTMVAK
jgi:hypothetical protein